MNDIAYKCYGVIDLSKLDTTPGGYGPLAPPAGWTGDKQAYLHLMRCRYKDMGARQHLLFAARLYAGSPDIVSVTGPFSDAALTVLNGLRPLRFEGMSSKPAKG
ncbi:hypothetical protein [Modicisalibacter sp. MOD 31.J]|uniref:hypothetical protein n=1 Tax=Modicisalibacter sp. MOD 31.J TaxID=2831897 RepID=UPI001CC917F9|nr:hypothetical protein [Modicisalibacter sp. MOD 31.J]MBZ9574540.1 hypothetical protein [Modicisalibacter sp. MOD 31.J]